MNGINLRMLIDDTEQTLFTRLQMNDVTPAQLEELDETDLAEKYENWLADTD